MKWLTPVPFTHVALGSNPAPSTNLFIMSIEEAEEKIKALEEENKKLKEQISNDS